MALNSRGKAVLRVGVVIQDFPSLFHLLVQLSHAGRAADSLLCPPTSRGFSCLNGAWPATPRQVRGVTRPCPGAAEGSCCWASVPWHIGGGG